MAWGGRAVALDASAKASTEAEFVELACAKDRADVDPRRPITVKIAERCPSKAQEIWQKRQARQAALEADEAARQQQIDERAARDKAVEAARVESFYAKQKADEAVAANQQIRLNTIKADKKQMAIVLGAVSCAIQFQKTSALDEIAKEKKYAKLGGGIVDKRKLYELQEQIRKADETMATFKAKAKNFPGVIPLSCKNADVQKTLTCHDAPETDGCGQREADHNVFVADFVDDE